MTPHAVLRKQGTSASATVRRILSVFDRATVANLEAGAQWYPLAGQIARDLADTNGTDLETSVAVIAHLSPRTPWARNVAGASVVLSGHVMPGLLSRNLAGAIAALNSHEPLATLTGRKTKAFAANILGDEDEVTIDVWAQRVALGVREDEGIILKRVGVYDALVHCYRLAAAKRGVSPSTMQATTWVVARNGRSE